MRGEAFCGRELCRLDTPLDHASFAFNQFQLAQAQQVGNMVLVLRRTLLGQFVILVLECRQAQLFEVVLQKDLRGVGHAGTCDIRLR
jgi:hypothetical protein